MKHLPGLVLTSLIVFDVAHAADPETAGGRYVPIPFEIAREQAFAFAAAVEGDPETAEPSEIVRQIWQNVEAGIPTRGVHDLVLQTFAASDPATAEFLATLDLRNPPRELPDFAPLTEPMKHPFYAANVRAHVARFLVDARMYDEALSLFDEIDLATVVDPATALFYRAVCEHQLLMKNEGLKSIAALLDRTDAVPESYAAVARLMQADLEALEADSLDEVAGLMRDVERRLDLARGGQRVQKREDEIVAKLDEMIKKVEQQMSKSNGGAGSAGGNSNRSSNPAGESVVKGSTAPGNVDEKDVRRRGDWGDLPPREREQAKNEIEKAFPANYSRLINEYFLKRTRTDPPAGE
ncbi:MAG: hypothetical protein WBC44_04160 [Planctomycetaceae bacterium]